MRSCGHDSVLRGSTFHECAPFSSICITSPVKISYGSFCADCVSLSHVTFESGCQLSMREDRAFRECESLESIWILSSLEPIPEHRFDRCENLSDVRSKSERKHVILGESAFEDCPSLQSICLPSSVDVTGHSNLFGDCRLSGAATSFASFEVVINCHFARDRMGILKEGSCLNPNLRAPRV